MSGIEPFQFEPTYPPGEEPSEEEIEDGGEDEGNDASARIGNTEWCICGVCVSMPTADECYCCQELEELNQKFDASGLYLVILFFHLTVCSDYSLCRRVRHIPGIYLIPEKFKATTR